MVGSGRGDWKCACKGNVLATYFTLLVKIVLTGRLNVLQQ